jgi:hypothetical protein
VSRLVLTLKPGAIDQLRLEPCVRLASELGFELEALLIEDQDLLTVAGLPFCQEVIRHSARCRELSTHRLENTIRQLSLDLQERLRLLTRQSPVHWDLRIYRGHWFEGLVDGWSQTDLLVLARGESEYHTPPSRRVDTAVAVLSGSDGAGYRALQLAARLARIQKQPLLVLALPDSPYQSLQDLPAGMGRLRFESVPDDNPLSVRRWLPCMADNLVLPLNSIWPDGLPAPHPLLDIPGIQTLVVR